MSVALNTVTDIMNAARMRLNDRIETLFPVGGQILQNTQAFSQTSVNNAWSKLCQWLRNRGFSYFIAENIYTAVPAVTSVDPSAQVRIGYDGYFDGTTLQANPVLPSSFLAPLEMQERQSGAQASFTHMDRIVNGLPFVPHQPWNRSWQWVGEAGTTSAPSSILMPGATLVTDIWIRYTIQQGAFVDIGSSPWFAANVPIPDCLDSFSLYLCAEYSIARGDMDGAAMFLAAAEQAAQKIIDRETQGMKGIYKAAEYSKMADKYTPTMGPDTQPIKRS